MLCWCNLFGSILFICMYAIFVITVLVVSKNPTLTKIFPGMNLILFCEFGGIPEPSLAWLRDGVALVDGTNGVVIETTENISKLSVSNGKGVDSGEYVCNASSMAGYRFLAFTAQCEYTNIIVAIIVIVI